MKQDKNATRPSGVSRRTVVKGAAWAVPAITVASAVPAVAASGDISLIQTNACKSPGNSCKTFKKGYIFTFSTTNTYACSITVTSAPFTLLTGSTPGTLTLVTPLVIATGTTPALEVRVNAQNSGNSTFTGYFTLNYKDCDGIDKTERVDVVVTGTPPDCPCPPA